MPSKYETASDETVPIVRLLIAKELIKKYKLKETEVASYLGVAQAAVSKYMTGKYSERLKERIKVIEGKMQGHRELIDSYIRKISEGKKEYAGICICTICGFANGFFCAFSSSGQSEELKSRLHGMK
jgi:predicted transcriptional regulator